MSFESTAHGFFFCYRFPDFNASEKLMQHQAENKDILEYSAERF